MGYKKVLCINSEMIKLEEFVFLGAECCKTHKTDFNREPKCKSPAAQCIFAQYKFVK